ncbi:hypothetical protein BpHYR1_015789 [Brachionus plicatilis]|uniref:Uncharacterized protein n=1 Tax=Brachionus plicatilis TaxID=10195 RepID=A0A3M7T3I6_BRAPC|nr:hypothetical protein BpHYR1_015789 [Brachionus plicatilis]
MNSKIFLLLAEIKLNTTDSQNNCLASPRHESNKKIVEHKDFYFDNLYSPYNIQGVYYTNLKAIFEN